MSKPDNAQVEHHGTWYKLSERVLKAPVVRWNGEEWITSTTTTKEIFDVIVDKTVKRQTEKMALEIRRLKDKVKYLSPQNRRKNLALCHMFQDHADGGEPWPDTFSESTSAPIKAIMP